MVPQLQHLKGHFLWPEESKHGLTMTQRRFNALAILNSTKSLVDKLPLVAVGSDFVDSQPNRRNDFGDFIEDLKL